MNGAAIRTSPAFHPQSNGESDKVSKSKAMPPQAASFTPGAGFWFFPMKMFSKLLNFFEI
jgi:hypothetical protein